MSEQENEKLKPEDDAAPVEDTGKLEDAEVAVDEPAVEGETAQPEEAAEVVDAPASVSSDDIGPEEQEEEAVEELDPLEQAREENKKLREQVLRLAADFDNFRKRARRENEDGARRAKIDMLRELLPVFDNMERAVAHAEQATDAKAVATGVQMVIKQFQDTVGKLGVERVKSVGEAFDPNVHEAIQQIETADQVAGTVVAEMLPGYLWGDRLLRASMVVVAKAPPEPEPVAEPVAEPEAEVVEAEGVTIIEEAVEETSDGDETPKDPGEPNEHKPD
jgi:molecular chaperone GrpE